MREDLIQCVQSCADVSGEEATHGFVTAVDSDGVRGTHGCAAKAWFGWAGLNEYGPAEHKHSSDGG